MENKYHVNINVLEYNSLLHAIPRNWKQTLTMQNITNESINNSEELHLKVNTLWKPVPLINNKNFYSMIDNTKQLPEKCVKYWETQLQTNFTESQWKNLLSVCQVEPNPRIQSFQYSIIHNFFPCNYYLSKWKKNYSANCDLCDTRDDIMHYFYNCISTRTFWQSIQNWYLTKTNHDFKFNAQSVILGIHSKGKNMDAINFFILQAKWYIYQQKKSGKSITLTKFIEIFKHRMEIERHRYIMNERQNTFEDPFNVFKDL